MGLFNSKPARQQAIQSTANVIADLDALVAERVAFRFKGQAHFIEPVTTKEFYQYVNASNQVLNVIRDPQATATQVIDAAHRVIASVCKTISREDVENMTQPQIGALLTLVVETVTGKSQVEKKKTLTH